jgi:hypothetical protein
VNNQPGMTRVLIAAGMLLAGTFSGALAGGLLVRLAEVFMRSQASALAYTLTMVLGVAVGGVGGLALADEVRR